jgi:hypothetical protein
MIKHSRHHRMMRKVTDKKWFIDCHVLVGMDGLAELEIEHPVDQEKGITVRQMFEDFVNIHCVQDLFSICSSFFSSSATRSASLARRLICAALCNHSWCPSSGKMLVYCPARRRLLVTIRARRDMHIVGEFQVTDDHAGAANGAATPDAGTAGDPDTAGHRRMLTNTDVVTDLNLIVEFDAIADHRVVQSASVDRRIGTDFDIVTQSPPDRFAGS